MYREDISPATNPELAAMTCFVIRIEGEGLRAEIVGDRPVLWGLFTIRTKHAIAGFYATRYIEADDADMAIDLARAGIKHELVDALPHGCGAQEGLVLRVDDIYTVDPKKMNPHAKGFTFFQE